MYRSESHVIASNVRRKLSSNVLTANVSVSVWSRWAHLWFCWCSPYGSAVSAQLKHECILCSVLLQRSAPTGLPRAVKRPKSNHRSGKKRCSDQSERPLNLLGDCLPRTPKIIVWLLNSLPFYLWLVVCRSSGYDGHCQPGSITWMVYFYRDCDSFVSSP